jgi:hypothetical protein
VRLQAEDDAITAQNDAIWGLIAPFLANQIARITIDFKMSIIKPVITLWKCSLYKICKHNAKNNVYILSLYSEHTCIYTYRHVSTRIYAYLRISACIYTYLRISTCIYMYLRVSTHIRMYLHVSTRIYAYPHASARIYAYLRISTCIYPYLRISACIYK